MCGRFMLDQPGEIVRRFQAQGKLEQVGPMFNIAPGRRTPVVARQSPNRVELMRWGLIPSWAKDAKIGWRTINARAETVRQKPAFRGPFRHHRCLVPASGFYEWRKTPQWESALLHPPAGWAPLRVCRAPRRVARRGGAGVALLHDHHDHGERAGGADP